jgi:hypothetical protein
VVTHDFIEVRNWGRYQHYTERHPPWIKLYTVTFDEVENPDMAALGVPSRYLALMLMILASETGNRIPVSIPWLTVETKMTYSAARRALAELRKIGFVRDADWNGELDLASATAEVASTDAIPKETETESLLRKLVGTRKSRPLDEVWEVLVELFGPVGNAGTSAHGKRNKAVRDFKALGATPDTIRLARKRWERKFEGSTPTDMALAVHYPALMVGVNLAPDPPCPECEVGGGQHAAGCERAR